MKPIDNFERGGLGMILGFVMIMMGITCIGVDTIKKHDEDEDDE